LSGRGFFKGIKDICDSLKTDFCLIGEVLFGDYNRIVNDEMCHSCTNYECYKNLYSSFNDLNLFEINYSLNRQFGNEAWTLYKGKSLLSFADNHDVTRIASILKDRGHLPLVYGLLFGMPGIPCIYYGSEWGVDGVKEKGSDKGLRPYFDLPQSNALTHFVAKLAHIRKKSKALCHGGYRTVLITNGQLIFERCFKDERVVIALNAQDREHCAHVDLVASNAVDLLTGHSIELCGDCSLPPYSVYFWSVN